MALVRLRHHVLLSPRLGFPCDLWPRLGPLRCFQAPPFSPIPTRHWPPLHPVPALPLLHISPSRLIFLFRFVAADGEGRHRRCGPGCEGGRVSEEGVSGRVGGWEGKTRRAVNQGVEASEFHPDSSRSVKGAKSAPVASVSHQTP